MELEDTAEGRGHREEAAALAHLEAVGSAPCTSRVGWWSLEVSSARRLARETGVPAQEEDGVHSRSHIYNQQKRGGCRVPGPGGEEPWERG